MLVLSVLVFSRFPKADRPGSSSPPATRSGCRPSPCGVTAASQPLEELSEERKAGVKAFDDFIGEHWGTGRVFQFMTSAPSDPAVVDLLSRHERNAATPAAAQAVWRRAFTDSRPFLSSISAPTLVLAHSNDPLTPIEMPRATAKAIAAARLVELDSSDHGTWDNTKAPDLDIIEEFLTGSRHTSVPDRVLATVLYTDIVKSTERASAIGDRRWRDLLDQHDSAVRQELARFGGREVNTTGDGFLTAFDGPARAISCALAIQERAKVLGIDVRAGLHTGECEIRGDDLAGIAVHVGARVAFLADAGEVLVSRTVHDLVIGSDIEFQDRGEHELRGIPGSWQLFAVTGLKQ